MSLSRAVYDALLPPGAIWTPEDEAGLDLFLDGISDNSEFVRLFLADLALLRNSQFTPILSDMEKEYGLVPNDRLTESERRARLLSAKTSRFGFGSDYMQDKLQEAGFDVQVHINNPPVDPNLFIFEAFKCTAGNITSVAGNTNAVAGGIGGELIVNGDFYTEVPTVSMVAGGEFAVAGSDRAVAGAIFAIVRTLIEYSIPAGAFRCTAGNIKSVAGNTEAVAGIQSAFWNLFFFVGGDAIRDGSGKLISIAAAEISAARRDELKRLIIKYKPTHSWCGLIVTFV